MKNILFSSAVIPTISVLSFGNHHTASALTLNWSYSSAAIEAHGTFITEDTPDNLGFYSITDISGTRNGQTITGLQPAGTSVLGNEPFKVDNLISLDPVKLTTRGFGYATVDGNFVNLFFASFLQPSTFLEVFSAPPFITGFENLGVEDSELPISFSVTSIVDPEPNALFSVLFLCTFVAASTFKGREKP